MKFSWKWASVVGVLILGIVGSVAVAAPKGGGGGSNSADNGADVRRAVPPGGPRADREDLADLAKELGVSTADLRDALDAVREDVGPPEPPRQGRRPSRAQLEAHCKELTDALASKLGKSGDDVRAAIKKVAKARIEADVDANRITRAQADRILARIDSAGCIPPFLGHHGCGPGPGHREGGRGSREFRGGAFPGPPPGAPAPAVEVAPAV